MKRSEIFDAFVKIAQDKGMIRNDSSEAKKKIEQTGRAGSDDISTIEALYGVKPDSEIKYDNNIMEAAHPNSIVISPSYDKLNGLVENNIERQNIIHNIVMKPVNGLSTQHKYAEKELLLSLVRIGNDLDNNSQEKLRVLADTCLEQVAGKKKLKKQAFAQIVIGAVAAVLVGVYLKNHLPFVNEGFQKNSEKLSAELDDLIEANQSTQTALGAGYTYKPAFIAEMQKFKTKVDAFGATVQGVIPYIEKLEQPKDSKELLAVSQHPVTGDAKKAYDALKAAYIDFLPYIKSTLTNFSSENYKLRQIEEKGILSKMVDAPQIFHGGKGLVADDFDDVSHALITYQSSILEIAKVLRGAQSINDASTQQLQEAQSQANNQMPDLEIGNKAVPNQQAAPTGEKTVQDVDSEVEQFDKELEM